LPRSKSSFRRGDLELLAKSAREVEVAEKGARERVDGADAVEGFVASMLPWVTSFALHAALVGVAIWLIWSIPLVGEDRPIIPSATLGGTPGPPLESSTPRPKLQSTALSRAARSVTASVSPLESPAPTDRQLIGAMGGGGSSSLFAAAPAPAGGEVAFYGLSGGHARKVVWVVDASGGMIDTLPFVLKELRRAVNGLRGEQSFSVVFFQEDRALEAPPAGLKVATAANKRAALEWAQRVVPRGTSNPLAAIERALSHRPELIYLLSDNITGAGRFEIDRRRLLASIGRVNTSGTKINTIQFLYRDKLEEAGLKPTLELIAQRTGGQYRFLSRAELGLE